MASGISVIINTLNEEAHIADCIRSVQALADEIVVCDMYSDDRTVEIAERLGARVVYHPRLGFADPAHRFAVEHATQEWILSIDADERMMPRLAERLRQIAQDGAYDAVDVAILFDYFGGFVKQGGFFNATYHRFFRRQRYLDAYDPIEEQPHHCFETILKFDRRLTLDKSYYLLHLAYPTIEKYVHKTLGMYASLEAAKMRERGARFRLGALLGLPLIEFLRRYVRWRGYREGIRGLILCTLYSGFIFLTWANLWLMELPPMTGDEGVEHG